MGEETKRGKNPRKFTWQEILTFVAGAGYVASPIDLLSEGVLGPLGLGDDAIAVVIAGVTLFKALQRFRRNRPGAAAAGDTTPGPAPKGTSVPGGTGPGTPPPGKTIPGTGEDVTDRKHRR
jgi:hypothetical protein